ncbi:MAG: hypothetical protein U0136_15445 [Bdellovibrionota bacterium]
MKRTHGQESGFALIATMIMLGVMLALLGAYGAVTNIELATTKGSKDLNIGFNTAEAGLNLRAETIRQVFVGYNRPTGTSPTATNACSASNQGAGDFRCVDYTLGNHTATTYVNEDPTNPIITTIPVGERYQNLSAQEYRYTAASLSSGIDGGVETALELRFKSRLVPLFQFAAFYNKDLEILPGPAMTLSGPVHTNGDLYLNANTSLAITGQVTTGGSLYRGRKDDASCMSTPVSVKNPTTAVNLKPSCPARIKITSTDVVPYNGMIQMSVPPVDVPQPEAFDPTPGKVYWDKADLRLVLRLNSSDAKSTTYATTGVEVWKQDRTVDTTRTNNLNGCAGSIGGKVVNYSSAFTNKRENKAMRLLDVDMVALLNCIYSKNLLESGRALSDTTEGGLVFFLTVDGPNKSASANRYGFRVRNAAQLRATTAGAPIPVGMTLVSDQAAYLAGNYNSTNKIPAAVMADSLNLLSNAWDLTDASSNSALSSRIASNTTYNAAFLAGTDSTGGIEGATGQSHGNYNGGLENYPRFHEDWSGKTMTYRGSFVSLNLPRHVNGTWSAQSYSPPARDWNYDTSFNNAANLPPITPRFVYLRQQLFLRDYEL